MVLSKLEAGSEKRLRLGPKEISDLVDHGRSPERIIEHIRDVGKREGLAEEILSNLDKLPKNLRVEAKKRFPTIEALDAHLEKISEMLPKKKGFIEKMKQKGKGFIERVKGIFKHPIIKAVIIGLVLWWLWGHIHGLLATGHEFAALPAEEGLGTITEAPAVGHTPMGEAVIETPGGGGVGAPAPADIEVKPDLYPTEPPPAPPLDEPPLV